MAIPSFDTRSFNPAEKKIYAAAVKDAVAVIKGADANKDGTLDVADLAALRATFTAKQDAFQRQNGGPVRDINEALGMTLPDDLKTVTVVYQGVQNFLEDRRNVDTISVKDATAQVKKTYAYYLGSVKSPAAGDDGTMGVMFAAMLLPSSAAALIAQRIAAQP